MEEAKKQCSKCRGEIDSLTKKCLHCGNNSKGFFAKYNIFIILVVLFLLSVFFSKMMRPNGASRVNNATTQATSTVKTLAVSDFIEIKGVELKDNNTGTPELYVAFKNISQKTIDAVDFSVELLNNYNEPTGQFNYSKSEIDNIFSGIIQEKINPDQMYVATFNLFSFEQATKVKNPIITRLHLTDGQTIE